MLMSRRDMNSFGPVLENVSFRNTRFDPNQTRFGRLAGKMAAAFGYSADLPGDRRLLQLLRLRVAQLNPCSYCLILHTEVAIKVRIPPVVIAAQERAALAYCEALTVFSQERFAKAHDELRIHFSERDVAEMAAVIINMNLWTRLKLAQGAVPIASASPPADEPTAPDAGGPA